MRSGLRPWLRLLAGAAILLALGWQFGTEAFLDGLRAIDAAAVLAALGIGLLTTVCNAGRWRLIADRLGLRLPLATAVADYYRAMFLNVALPAGVLGDVHRAVNHGRHVGDLGRGVRAVVLERVAGQAVLIVLAAAVLLTQPALLSAAAPGLLPQHGAAIAAAGALISGAAFAVWIRRGRSGSRRRRAATATMADLRLGLLSRNVLPGVVLLSVAALGGYVVLFLVAARSAGVTAPFAQLLPLILLALLVMALPLNVGGWGPREAAAALSFAAAGLDPAQGLAASVAYGVLTFLSSLPGLGVLLLRRGTRGEPEGDRPAPREPEGSEEPETPVSGAASPPEPVSAIGDDPQGTGVQ